MENIAQKLANLRTALHGRHFLTPADLTVQQWQDFLCVAAAQKQDPALYRVDGRAPLAGKSAALIFFNPSLRTRLSMSLATRQLGGDPYVLDVGGHGSWNLEYETGVKMDRDKPEHIGEAARVLSEMVDVIGVRCFPQFQSLAVDATEPVLSAFVKYSTKPIVNMESSLHHPCQSLADMLTIREDAVTPGPKKVALLWVPHPKPLPLAVPQSFALAAASSGHDLTICAPKACTLPVYPLLRERSAAAGGQLRQTDDLREALADCDYVYVKSWSSVQHYADLAAWQDLTRQYAGRTCDAELMQLAPRAKVMHCLPVRRNVEISEDLLEGPRSLVIEGAANRLHAQKTLLGCMGGAS